MKRIFRITVSVILSAIMLLATVCLPASAETESCFEYTSTNINAQEYKWDRWSNPIYSYLAPTSDGGLMRFQYETGNDYFVEYFDGDFNIKSTRMIPAELSVFGGFYSSGTNYYVLTGENNPNQLSTVECFRITKYDLSWNRLGSAGLFDCNTTVPFDAGCARFDMCGKYLIVRTAHEMYASTDGLNHQANVTIQVDTSTMTITDSLTKVWNSVYGYVSHSFNQFLKVDGNTLIAVDHGDAYPRSVALFKYGSDLSSGTFYSSCEQVDVLPIAGQIGANDTGVAVGGFEISDTSYLVAYNAIEYGSTDYFANRNVYVGVVDRSDLSVSTVKLTDFASDGTEYVSVPKLVKLSGSAFLVIWSVGDTVFYQKINADGAPVGSVCSEKGAISDCQPVVVGGTAIWYTYDEGKTTFYSIASDMSASVKTVASGHDYNVVSYPSELGGDCIVSCTKCHNTDTIRTPSQMLVFWGVGKDESSLSSAFGGELPVGGVYSCRVTSWEDGVDESYTIEYSGGDVKNTESKYDGRFNLTFPSKGIYRLRFTYVYNPAMTVTYTVNVGSTVLGDINEDNNIDTLDYAILKRGVLGTYELSDFESGVGDLNGDMSIDSIDYVLLKRAVLGTYTIK